MCVRSQQVTLWELLGDPMPLSAGSPASLGASQANNAEQTTPATCGPSTTVLSATCVHGGYSARTCPVCCLKVPTQSSPIWTQRATPAGRSYWVLTTSARRTAASACSSSPDSWPTAQARDWKGASGRSLKGEECDLPHAVQMWPTPTVMEAGKVGNQANHGQLGLSNHPAIVGQVERPKGVKSGKELLGSTWSTPATRLVHDGAYEATLYQRNSLNLVAQAMVADGLVDPANPRDGGSAPVPSRPKAPRLNPRWVAQLMGFPADWLDGVSVPSKG